MRYVGDLTDPSTIRACLHAVSETWGAINAVVANIGSGKSVAGWLIDPEEWARVFQLNFFGTVNLIGEVMPQLIDCAPSSVVIIGSIAGVEATAAPLAYGSAKSALLNYSKNLARQVAAAGVRVNVVAPGNILFPGGSWEQRVAANPAQVESYLRAEVPMRRFGTPEEIADFVVMLSSPKASFATGMCAVVDGGQTRST
jgi:3-oxoacyl-[acyl-carrier protein] reductase